MTTDTLRVQPPRLVLVNLVTGEQLEAWANPPSLTEHRSAQWNRLGVPGLGHQPLQYGGTTNRRVPDVVLNFDRRTYPDADLEGARRFLDTLVAPAGATAPSAPPRVLLVWPKLLSLEAVTESVETVHDVFSVDGTPIAMAVKLAFEHVVELRALAGGGR
jgi:hypothetical protein